MKRFILILPLLLCSCQFQIYDNNGMSYVRGQIGLGIDNKNVPNLIELDAPIKDTKVVSPVLEDLAEVSFRGSGGLIKWLGSLSSRALSFVGLAL